MNKTCQNDIQPNLSGCIRRRQPAYEKRVVDNGLDVGKVQSAKLFAAFRATPQPEDGMPITVFGEFSVHPLTAAAFNAVK